MAKILVFSSDSWMESEALGLVMEFGGHDCTPAHSLEEALNLANNNSFDLAVVHLELNASRVKKAVQILQAAFPRTIALVPSKKWKSADAADGTIRLPCTPEELLAGVAHALNRSPQTRKQAQPARSVFVKAIAKKHLRTAG